MKKREPYKTRLEMAKMHDKYLSRLDVAMDGERYVEASWLCYAIFEQRIDRIIRKHIHKCPKSKRTDNMPPVSISTKIDCLQRLTKQRYGPYADFDKSLLKEIKKWCDSRNELIHGLVSLEHYKQYDTEFAQLAKCGVPLVQRLYQQATLVREWCRGNSFTKFPESNCKCKYKCIKA